MIKDDDGDQRHRNVPNRLKVIEERLATIEREIAETVEEVATDVVPDLVRGELKKAFAPFVNGESEPGSKP